MEDTYYIYEIYDPNNKMYYVGKRKRHYKEPLQDGYLGSSSIMRTGGYHFGKFIDKQKIDWNLLQKKILYENLIGQGFVNFIEVLEIENARQKYGKENVYNQQNGGNGGYIGKSASDKASLKKKGKKWTSKRSYKILDISTHIVYDSPSRCREDLKISSRRLSLKIFKGELKILDKDVEKIRLSEITIKVNEWKKINDFNNQKAREYRRLNPKQKGNRAKGKTYEEAYGLEKALEYKEKLKNSLKGKHSNTLGKTFYTNGTINVVKFECPDGFWKGKTLNKFKVS